MRISSRYQHKTSLLQYTSVVILSLLLLNAPKVVLAGAGHDHSGANSFQAGGEVSGSVTVDAETAKRLGIKVESVKKQQLDVGIKTTGQIETLPDQKVEVTAPLTSKVVELLVKPGSKVKKGQPVAVVASPELVDLRVGSQEKQADAQGALQKAQVNLQLAQENLDRQQTIYNAEIAQARTQLNAAQAQYNRDLSLVNQRGVLKVAQENLKRQQQIANAEIAQATTEVAVAQEQYDRDKELVEKGALPRRQMLESQAKLERAKAELAKAKSLPQVVQAESEVKRAEVDLPLRELRDSQSRVAEAQSQLKRAETRKDVLEAQAQLKRAKSDVVVAQSQLKLSNTTYQTRLEQLGSTANAKGLVTVTAPISGTVASREVSIGQSLQDAGGKLMTIINDGRIFATANIYEKDLGIVKNGQRIRVKVASFPNQTFEGRITQIGTSVQGETRVVPVQAEINNSRGSLKPGMFAELEVITDKTASSLLAIPTSAVVDANGKKIIYVQNGNAFQSTQVTFGQTSGDMVEVKTGLFEGDMVVTQRATQLYAQSLRGGSKKEDGHAEEEGHAEGEKTEVKANNFPVPLWLIAAGGGSVITAIAFSTSNLLSRRKGSHLVTVNAYGQEIVTYETDTQIYLDNHKQTNVSPTPISIEKQENS
ncbi:efflux RND transporter periplasmic adaptor subunit [Hassallia byssoidea VB512170]|uniref:Efflux RND transporter periplasmic adaptor subunit n=1 Tax=Hassallia byssoidea VB512170 TaxID=1304833 RepID=A0A846H3I3_9CYAN|nr:efflux RND transporter periplasmic adaptor subunit [Hassalia byssoidea]NEU71775.1 efflux RND transporter periplasmic adaptor subunit [Hassalia byssoidea VB512170]